MEYSLPGGSPRYDRYEAKMRRLARLTAGLRRHPILSMGALGILVVGILALLLSVGRFSGNPVCPDVVYGDAPQCGLKAFLSRMDYQYAPAEGDPIWSDTLPTQPGLYRIRAVSRNGLGQRRFSQAMTFRLLPRPLEARVPDGSFLYGDTPTATAAFRGLAPGDEATAEYITKENDGRNLTISAKNIKIRNKSGEDVTGCYDISTTDGLFTMTQRPITVTAQSAEKVYDGAAWDQGKATLTKGSLAPGDTLEIAFESAPAQVGSHPLTPQCTVLNGDGANVTDCYKIQAKAGTLTVQPRPLQLETGSASKVYDGLPLTQPDWWLTEGEPVSGHTLTATATGAQTAVGEGANTLSVQITDEQGRDQLSNYHLTLSMGKLTVTRRPIVVQSESAEKPYDGTPLVCKIYTVSEDTFRFGKEDEKILRGSFTGSQTEIGSSANTFTVEIVNGDGAPTTENYDITYVYGTLTVTDPTVTTPGGNHSGDSGGDGGGNQQQEVITSLTVCAFSATKIYDGTGFEAFDLAQYTILSGQLRPGHRLEVDYAIDGEPITPGTYRNTITQCRVYDESGKDVTAKYTIHPIGGALTILPRQLTVTLGSATKVFDGTGLACPTYWLSQGSLAPGHELRLVIDTVLSQVGQLENSPSQLDILSGDKIVTDCYQITVIPGKLEITEP